jgi:septal ring factor EnvC (AmiA/AmiB activator)
MSEWLGGVALIVSALATLAAWWTGSRQNRRAGVQAGQFETDRIRSAENNNLIKNLQADNDDLRATIAEQRTRLGELRAALRATQRKLEQVSADCRDCQQKLDELSGETYGHRRFHRPDPGET